MRVTVLVDNVPHPGSGVEGEGGLSLLVEAHGRRMLYDTGASGLLLRNADVLGVDGPLA